MLPLSWQCWRRYASGWPAEDCRYTSLSQRLLGIGSPAERSDAAIWVQTGERPGIIRRLRISSFCRSELNTGHAFFGKPGTWPTSLSIVRLLRMPRLPGTGLPPDRRFSNRAAANPLFRVRRIRSPTDRPNATLHAKSSLRCSACGHLCFPTVAPRGAAIESNPTAESVTLTFAGQTTAIAEFEIWCNRFGLTPAQPGVGVNKREKGQEAEQP
jgi:hypothetical protein